MNFKCSIENDSKKAIILKEIDPLLNMKELESIIAKKLELKTSFQILTGYPPATLLYETTDLVNSKLKGNDLLLIKLPSTTESTNSKKNKPTSKKTIKHAPVIEKKNTNNNTKTSSSLNISYFSDQISKNDSWTKQPFLGDKKQDIHDDDDYEMND